MTQKRRGAENTRADKLHFRAFQFTFVRFNSRPQMGCDYSPKGTA